MCFGKRITKYFWGEKPYAAAQVGGSVFAWCAVKNKLFNSYSNMKLACKPVTAGFCIPDRPQ